MEVKEAYCSYEVARLLKEKGFDELCIFKYNSEGIKVKAGKAIDEWSNTELEEGECSAPTHQRTCAWIRTKGYSVEVHATAVGWHWEVCKINGTSIAFGGNVPSDNTNDGGAFDGYDECMDNALMYALTYLI